LCISRSRGFTKAGLLAIVAVFSVAGAALIPALAPGGKKASQQSDLVRCRENLRQIGAALLMYAGDNGGALPMASAIDGPHGALVHALSPRYIGDAQRFYCPGETNAEWMYSERNFNGGAIGYFYYGAAAAGTNENLSRFLLTEMTWPRELNTKMDGRMWVMSDRWFSGVPTSHAEYRKGVNYLMLDGGVDFVAESPRQAFR
jgi:hypothetical protein